MSFLLMKQKHRDVEDPTPYIYYIITFFERFMQ